MSAVEFAIVNIHLFNLRWTVFSSLAPPRNLEEVDLIAVAVKDGGV